MDLIAAADYGVKCLYAPVANSTSVAETALMLMLYMSRNVTRLRDMLTVDFYDAKLKTYMTTLNGKTVASTNYSVTYKNNTKVGVATVVISGKGAYTGSVTKKFKINPKSVALSSLKARKKAVQVKWKKSSMKVSGYQVSYSTSKSFKKAKTTSVKYTKSVKSKTVKKLKSKKKYYVRVRTYTKTSAEHAILHGVRQNLPKVK